MSMKVRGYSKLDWLVAVRTKDGGWVELSRERGTGTDAERRAVAKLLAKLAKDEVPSPMTTEGAPMKFAARIAAAIHELNCSRLSEDLIELTPTQDEYDALIERELLAVGAAAAVAAEWLGPEPRHRTSKLTQYRADLAALIAAELLSERERCAKVCERQPLTEGVDAWQALACAAEAIRAQEEPR